MNQDFSYKTPKLSPRLYMVANMVPSCERVVDIGTDHAFIPIFLIFENRCSEALASDINTGPALVARRNIEKYQMEDVISVVVGDGLENIEIMQDDCVVIAGMGGYEIQSILEKNPIKAKAVILQPQKSLYELREFLSKAGYEILEENITKEKDHMYTAIKTKYTGIPYELSVIEKEIGPCLLKVKPKHFVEYLETRKIKLEKQIKGNQNLADVLDQINDLIKSN